MSNDKIFLEDLFSFISSISHKPWNKDNIGILIPSKTKYSELKHLKIYICSDFNQKTLDFFKSSKDSTNILITYHPIIFFPIKKLSNEMAELIKYDVAVLSVHTILDRKINIKFAEKILAKKLHQNIFNEEGLACYAKNSYKTNDILSKVKEITGCKKLVTSLESGKIYKNILIGVGSYDFKEENIFVQLFEEEPNKVELKDCLIITGEMSYHSILEQRRKGNGVVLCGHFESENWYLEIFKEDIKKFLNEKKLEFDIFVDRNSAIVDFY